MSLFPLSNIMLIRSRVRHLLGDRPGKNLSTGPYALSVVRRPTPATSSATPTGRRWPTSISRGNPAGARRRSSSPGRGISLCNAELRTALLYNRLVRFLSEGQESTDVAREASFDEAKAQLNAVPVLSAAGLSLSLASGASAAIGRPAADMPTPKTGISHEIALCEEEISDVSLATFYVFDNENAGTFRRRMKLAQGGCGCGGGGCGDGEGCASCAVSTYSGAAPFGSYVTPPRYSKPTRKRRAGA
jgi:hypothetical protein